MKSKIITKQMEDWEKEFDREFAVLHADEKTYLCDFDKQELLDIYEPIKDFIKKKIEKWMKKTKRGKWWASGTWSIYYNEALSDLQEFLKTL